MSTIIIVTDFSQSAQNALRYACSFSSASANIELLLVNINSLPASYSGDGVALAAISDTLDNRLDKLKDEIKLASSYVDVTKIKYKALIGDFMKSLQELIVEEQARLVIIGTPAEYGEIWAWDTDILSALTDLPVPVLTIPEGVIFKPIENVSFACIPSNITSASPIEAIKKLITYTGAKLHVVTVVPPNQNQDAEEEAESALRKQLQEIDTAYYKIYEEQVVKAIGQFIEEHKIDILLVRPKKHGIWYKLFHKSHAKELARLNLIPVMALHDQWNVN